MIKPEKLSQEQRETALPELTGHGWQMVEGRDAISKRFEFADFNEAFGWMTRVAMIAEHMNHHPEWSNVYKTVDVTLRTHDVGGLSALDIAMATKMDRLAG
ncbi:4a-hydroxytetrahydrobiopterin dehydratase [Roseobacter sp. HKCCD9010]|uniref:4a-hydroxytetrahydrobiopterin dehydratase n=1 Tax=unclassified Roseobacter TaxID=196798 RepID=UPI0014918B21|nr:MULTISPECIES: 4a-hydroxytetrahydrobiopterin dehydratase [unclassified Roseobacter]MBF9051073.1 4a-hydroxytetrahydrobiopterin dehydratase [Rhodobacterales bacterium HKCCD4356]NNV12842.1 4a-hydroxytetrahydrobiopterin dehydratase [Roseobacter sp. HKCCD7357]NNV16787.1 4a-hydroxytetrahydrobiopterin dehydratase [Roseobacter sp. HKCCD8768]NNV26581.1 4a-hydroxytetrahydrobiopterin dehydratase [Roseobacter sp. HKCCD8192]NNV30508.1 4a-hydroxytetrahydrobiopterin dehydratase [Roseobacter sp. HKCCD9061]